MTLFGQSRAKVDRRRGFPDTAFLIDDGSDLHDGATVAPLWSEWGTVSKTAFCVPPNRYHAPAMSDSTQPEKAVLLASGGLDSTVASFMAAEEYELVLALTFDYGQRAKRRELAAGYGLANWLGIRHRTVFLPFYRELEAGALLSSNEALPNPDADALDDLSQSVESARAVWVPNRNGVLISIASAWAESLGATRVIVGFNAEEAKTFPDNTTRFVDASNRALSDSTANGVQVHAPTGEWSKAQIVQYAREKDWPLELVWSCYEDDDVPCEKCESCRRFERALDSADAREWLNARREKWRS